MKIVLIMILGGVIGVSGCLTVCRRDASVAKVADIGADVSTRYRYRLACAYDRETFQPLKTKWDFLSELQPNVFVADGGVPIVMRVKHKGIDISGNSQICSALLSMCSFFIIPYIANNAVIYDCFIEIDGVEDGSFFELIDMGDFATSYWIPTSFWWYNDPPVEGYCGFSQYTQTMTLTFPVTREVYNKNKGALGETQEAYGLAYTDLTAQANDFSCGLMQRALAYGVAVKLKELEDSGKIDAMLKKKAAEVSTAPKHNIIRLDRDSDKTFSYSFELELAQNPTDFKKVWQAVLLDFAKSLKEDYRDAFPSADVASLEVSFSGFKREGLRLSGHAAVLTLKPVSLEYNPHNRRGTMSVRFAEGQVSEASAWIRRNVKTLVRDKNIALTSGSLPPQGKFAITNEKNDGNVMTIEFMVE